MPFVENILEISQIEDFDTVPDDDLKINYDDISFKLGSFLRTNVLYKFSDVGIIQLCKTVRDIQYPRNHKRFFELNLSSAIDEIEASDLALLISSCGPKTKLKLNISEEEFWGTFDRAADNYHRMMKVQYTSETGANGVIKLF